MKTGHLLLAILLLPLGVLVVNLRAQEPFKPGKLAKEEIAKLKPGLKLAFRHQNGTTDERRSRLAALFVPADTVPTPFLEKGLFHAQFRGLLKTLQKGEYTFTLEVAGKATLKINDRTVFATDNQPVKATADLAKGYNKIELDFDRPKQGDALLRLWWSSEDFASEPVPPDALYHRDEPRTEASLAREGRFLYANLGCSRCHALPDKLARQDCAMPELEKEGPSLANAGQRFKTEWMARWIENPRAVRPEATMPRLLHGPNSQADAADLAAYLTSLAGEQIKAGVAGVKQIEQGDKLFTVLNCVACHRLDNPKKDDPLGRMSLFLVTAKFRPGALEAFLKAPHAHYPWIRMPDFKLTSAEAGALAAFLTREAKGTVEDVRTKEPPSAERGAKLFQTVGCANCHAVKTGQAPSFGSVAAPEKAALARGCLADAPGDKTADFGLPEGPRQALRTFMIRHASSLKREAAAEFSLRQVEQLQCIACHRRDGVTSKIYRVLEEEGAIPEILPTLIWTGDKIQPAWTAKLLQGQIDNRARPWLKARMPAFPARAALLAVGMSHEHGFAETDNEKPKHDPGLAEIGAKLIEMKGGFNCIMCHAAGSRKAVEPFEAPGINLLDAALRLRYGYYPRWMLDPPRVDIMTRMPKFSMDGKTTPIADVLDGDAHRQFEAIWHYVQTLPAKK